MNHRIWTVSAMLICFTLGNSYQCRQAVAADAPYLFDLVKKPTYKKAWEGMFRHEKGVPVWLVRVEGPATPVEQVKANGVTYQHTSVCKAHDCASNMFHVIFSADGRKAWGLLLVNETNERFFGAPDARMQVLLRNVLQQ